MAYFSLGQLLANIDETKKAFNQANYVLSESGLWIPVRASNAGEVFAQLKGRKLALPATVNYGQALNLAPGGSTTITVTPPAGEIWRLKLLFIQLLAPSGATTGTHTFKFRIGVNSDVGNLLSWSNAYSSYLEIHRNTITIANDKKPPNEAEQQRAILNAVVSNNAPLYLYYKNDTDATQTNTVSFYVLKEVEYIVS